MSVGLPVEGSRVRDRWDSTTQLDTLCGVFGRALLGCNDHAELGFALVQVETQVLQHASRRGQYLVLRDAVETPRLQLAPLERIRR